MIAPGMLSGTTGSMTGRLSVGCKSPLTGTIKESNAGGQAAQVLARLGYAAVILEGKPTGDDLYKIYINKDGIKVIVDNSLKLLDNVPGHREAAQGIWRQGGLYVDRVGR